MAAYPKNTNHNCNISWYLNGELRLPGLNVNNSSYYSSLIPGLYNLTCLAEAGDEKAAHIWNWTVHEWNPWESSTSRDGKNVTTAELQEAIHYYQNGLQMPRNGSKVSDELLKELITFWRGPG
jgi:hypothetical protein